MNIDSIKVELIDWIAQLNDQQSIYKLLNLKKKLGIKKKETGIEIFGSGKHLVGYIAEDFNEPLDMFKDYQK
jgi:hypothetical protein